MKTVLNALLSLIIVPALSFAEPQGGKYADIRAKALQMGASPEGTAYEKRFSKAFAKPMKKAMNDAATDFKPPFTIDLVFIINADGTLQQIVPSPEELISTDISIKLKNLKVPPPPKPGWMVAIRMDVRESGEHNNTGFDAKEQPEPPPAYGR